MPDLLLPLVVPLTAVPGWWLGKRSSTWPDRSPIGEDYYRDLNYLLNEQPDDSLDVFINALKVTPHTLETRRRAV